MRQGFVCTLILLGMAQVAAAAGTGVAAEPLLPGGELAMARAEEPATAVPSLDLRLDVKQLRFTQEPGDRASATEAEWDPDINTYEPHGDRGLSFGLEIKPRSRIGALARQDETEDAGLGDQLQRLIEQPVLGVRGRYRF